MPKILIETANLSEDDWLQWRRKGVGGSDAPIIMGVNPYQSVFDLWFKKLYGYQDEDDDQISQDKKKWGHLIEPLLAENWMEKTGKKLRRRNAILQHPEYPWMLATVDRLVVGENAGWEGKTTNAYYVDQGEPKELYEVQCQHYIAVFNADRWYISVLAGGQIEYEYCVERDQKYIDEVLIPAEKKFWELVKTETFPDYDGSDACVRMLNELYPQSNGNEIELPGDLLEKVEKYKQFSKAEKEAKTEKNKYANQLKGAMGDASKAILGDYKLYWSDVNKTSFNAKAFEKANPELYKEFLEETVYRRFSIK